MEMIMFKRRFYLFSFLILLFCLTLPRAVQAADASSRAGIVTTSGGNLNVRTTPSTGGTTVAALPNGSYITLISQSGGWWKVEYASGKFGYCHGDYIRTTTGSAATVTASALNVRSGPSTGNPISGYLHNGNIILVLSTANGWSRILYQGNKVGYVSAKYLSDAYLPVALSLPNFKQTDSRWANIPIGTSGKTFAQIGCATTAIAMMESYRNGSIITPDAMAKQLRYTASGSVYWPSHYIVTTDVSNYLSQIYSLLQAGKPVLFGAKNNSGGQHWVVITGYTGGSSLSTSAFTIHDPGSNSRTTLQQFLNAYPNFYKYFHY